MEWNKAHQDKCVGISWFYGIFGPAGERGGSECSLGWDMPVGGGFNLTGLDSARLIDVPL